MHCFIVVAYKAATFVSEPSESVFFHHFTQSCLDKRATAWHLA